MDKKKQLILYYFLFSLHPSLPKTNFFFVVTVKCSVLDVCYKQLKLKILCRDNHGASSQWFICVFFGRKNFIGIQRSMCWRLRTRIISIDHPPMDWGRIKWWVLKSTENASKHCLKLVLIYSLDDLTQFSMSPTLTSVNDLNLMYLVIC